MFENQIAEIYNGSFVKTGEAPVDFQPYEKTWAFEDGVEISLTHRVFCAPSPAILPDGYLGIGSQLYKIMRILPWDDFRELWLYACERSTP